MKRYRLERLSCDLCLEEHPDGEFYKVKDVDAMLDKILLAVREIDRLARKPYGMVSREKP